MADSSHQWQRWSLGYTERFVDDFLLPLSNGKVIRVSQAPKIANVGADRGHDPGITGSTVWDASIVLAQFLTSSPIAQAIFKEPIDLAIELGSGTGLVSMAVASACLVKNMVATDISGLLPLLTKNISQNRKNTRLGSHVTCRALRWGEEKDIQQIPELKTGNSCGLVFGSDLIYSDIIEQDALLLSTLQKLCVASTVVVFGLHRMHQPERVDAFVVLLRSHFSSVDAVPLEDQPPDWRSEDVVVVIARGIIFEQAS